MAMSASRAEGRARLPTRLLGRMAASATGVHHGGMRQDADGDRERAAPGRTARSDGRLRRMMLLAALGAALAATAGLLIFILPASGGGGRVPALRGHRDAAAHRNAGAAPASGASGGAAPSPGGRGRLAAAPRFEWDSVDIAGASSCVPVARTLQTQTRGLMGVRHPIPMVFAFAPPRLVSFWMKDTPSPLTGVWVDADGRVAGYWHGVPESLTGHPSPAPVRDVIEYPAGDTVPAVGSHVSVSTEGCPAGPRP